MDIETYQNPASFLPRGVLDYLDPVKRQAFIKRLTSDFIVREPVPGHPGRFLTTGLDSDFPGGLVANRPHTMVACTLVKERLTTSDAKGRLAQVISRTLGRTIDPESIQDSGLKDRWAETAQTVVIPGVTVDELRRCTFNHTSGRAGFFVKDVRPAFEALEMGDHGVNRFNLIVRVDMSAAEIKEYLAPRLAKLAARNMWVPNGYGRQRLGRRQNLHLVGRTLVSGDYKAPAGVNEFCSAAEAACYLFLFHSTPSEPEAARQVREKAAGYWLYNFPEMRDFLDRHWRNLNLWTEFKMVQRLADIDQYGGSFERVLTSMKKDSSLFVGAWQSYWWNQVLSRKLPGWTREMDEAAAANEARQKTPCTCNGRHTCYQQRDSRQMMDSSFDECRACECERCSARSERRFNPAKKSIPMLMDTPEARSYYGRLTYCQSAMRELNRADKTVRDLFLTPRSRAGQSGPGRGPWRKAFIRVEGFQHTARDGEWHVQFDLRSGAYATTFLGQLWNLADPDELPESAPAESE